MAASAVFVGALFVAAGAVSASPASARANGEIVFVSGGSLYALDPATKETKVIRRGAVAASFSPDGKFLAVVSRSGIVVTKPDGTGARAVTRARRPYGDAGPSWSPNSRSIAFTRTPSGARLPDLFRVDVKTQSLKRLTRTPTIAEATPAWSPRGTALLFAQTRASRHALPALAIVKPDGSRLHRLHLGPAAQPAWSPDGSRFAFSSRGGRKSDIVTTTTSATGLRNLTKGLSGNNVQPSWSPDGKQIAFASTHENRSGAFDLWVVGGDGTGLIRLTTLGNTPGSKGARAPTWQAQIAGLPTRLAKNVFAFYSGFGPREQDWHWDSLTHISIFAEALQPDLGASNANVSNTNFWRGTEVDRIRADAHAHGVKVLLTVTNRNAQNFSPDVAHDLTATAAVRAAAVAATVHEALVAENGDGVTVDFEKFRAEDARGIVAFVSELAKAVHAAKPGAQVFVTTAARNQKADVPALAAAADGIIIMTWVYHSEDSGPGPLSPLTSAPPWGSGSISEVINTFVKQGAPPGKLIPALHLGGHDWPAISDQPAAKRGHGAVKGVQYADFEQLVRAGKYQRRWDAATQTPYLVYQDAGGQWHQIWAEDPQSVAAKIDFIEQRGLWGLSMWGAGKEDASLWATIRRKLAVP